MNQGILIPFIATTLLLHSYCFNYLDILHGSGREQGHGLVTLSNTHHLYTSSSYHVEDFSQFFTFWIANRSHLGVDVGRGGSSRKNLGPWPLGERGNNEGLEAKPPENFMNTSFLPYHNALFEYRDWPLLDEKAI